MKVSILRLTITNGAHLFITIIDDLDDKVRHVSKKPQSMKSVLFNMAEHLRDIAQPEGQTCLHIGLCIHVLYIAHP